LPVLAGVVPFDLDVRTTSCSIYFISKYLTPQFLQPCDQGKIARLIDYPSIRYLFCIFSSVRDRLEKSWIVVDHCVLQFLTGRSNFKVKLYSFKLVRRYHHLLCVTVPSCSLTNAEFELTFKRHNLFYCHSLGGKVNVSIYHTSSKFLLIKFDASFTTVIDSPRDTLSFTAHC
jgi:hypothetical protein